MNIRLLRSATGAVTALAVLFGVSACTPEDPVPTPLPTITMTGVPTLGTEDPDDHDHDHVVVEPEPSVWAPEPEETRDGPTDSELELAELMKRFEVAGTMEEGWAMEATARDFTEAYGSFLSTDDNQKRIGRAKAYMTPEMFEDWSSVKDLDPELVEAADNGWDRTTRVTDSLVMTSGLDSIPLKDRGTGHVQVFVTLESGWTLNSKPVHRPIPNPFIVELAQVDGQWLVTDYFPGTHWRDWYDPAR